MTRNKIAGILGRSVSRNYRFGQEARLDLNGFPRRWFESLRGINYKGIRRMLTELLTK